MLRPNGFVHWQDEAWAYGGARPEFGFSSEKSQSNIGMTCAASLSLSALYRQIDTLLEGIFECTQLPDLVAQLWRDALGKLWNEVRSELVQGQIDPLQAGDVLLTLHENISTAHALINREAHGRPAASGARASTKTTQFKSNLLKASKSSSAKGANPAQIFASFADVIGAERSETLVWSSTSSAMARSLGELCLALAAYEIYHDAITEAAVTRGAKAKASRTGTSGKSFIAWLTEAKADVLLEWLDR